MNIDWAPGTNFLRINPGDPLVLDEVGTSVPFKIHGNFQVFNGGVTYSEYYPAMVGNGEDDSVHIYAGQQVCSPRFTINAPPEFPTDDILFPGAHVPTDGEGYNWVLDNNAKMGATGWGLQLSDGIVNYSPDMGIHVKCYKIRSWESLPPLYEDFPLTGLGTTAHQVAYDYPPFIPNPPYNYGDPYFAILHVYFRDIQLYRVIISRKAPGANPFFLLLLYLLSSGVYSRKP